MSPTGLLRTLGRCCLVIKGGKRISIHAEQLEIRLHHLGDEIRESRFRLPPEFPLRLTRVTKELVDFGWPEVTSVNFDENRSVSVDAHFIFCRFPATKCRARLARRRAR